jgi:chemotaxis signal transduction protein
MTTSTATMVCFRAGGAEYAVPVERVREVRSAEALLPLPTPRPGVIGLLSDRGEALTVIAPLGEGHDHVLLLDHDDRGFGLLVAEVTGVLTLDGEVGPAPAGQVGHFISGVVNTPGGLVLLVDVAALDESLRG